MENNQDEGVENNHDKGVFKCQKETCRDNGMEFPELMFIAHNISKVHVEGSRKRPRRNNKNPSEKSSEKSSEN